MNKKERVLILQAGFNEIGVINNLKKMGYYVISIGNQKGLIGQKYVDEYHCQDYSKKDEVLKFALEHDVDYICACCNDTAVLTSVYVAKKMNLQGYDSLESAEIIAHKDKFKEFAKEKNVITLPAEEFGKIQDAFDYVHKIQEYPIIVKPVDLSGGKGIKRCNDESEALEAIEKAFDYSNEKRIVIERFIEGTQHGFCTFLQNQKVVACCSNDENSVINPYRVEIDSFPASNIDKYESLLISQVELMARELNLVDGIFHLQYMESEGTIYILEAMRRIIGNMYSIPASKANDFDWDYWEAVASLGKECKEAPVRCENKGVYAYRAIIPSRDGILKQIVIDETLNQYIFDKIILEEPGKKIQNHKAATVGIVFFHFENKEQMDKVLFEQYDLIYAEMEVQTADCLRNAQMDDCEFLFELANDTVVRNNSFQKDKIQYEEHLKWFENVLLDDNQCQFIYMDDSERIGQGRITLSGDSVEIGYSIVPDKRGQGYGRKLVALLEKKALEQFPNLQTVYGRVKKTNELSMYVFQKEGYTEIPMDNYLRYEKKREDL